MRKHTVFRKKKVRQRTKTHEERAIDDIFAEEEGGVSVSIAEPEDKSVEAYDYVDYGLVADETNSLWEEIGKAKAQEVLKMMVGIAATLDGVKSAEAHLKETTQMDFDSIKEDFIRFSEEVLIARLKAMVIGDLHFTDEQSRMLFVKFGLRLSSGGSRSAIDGLQKFLSEQGKEVEGMSPYGVVKSLRDNQ
jgi:hypothetical protein